MNDIILLLIIIAAVAYIAIAGAWIYARGPSVKNCLLAPFISAGILIAIILPFIGGALLALLHYSKKYK